MKVLIDIGHPAHVHLFKNFAHEMVQKGHQVHFTCKDRQYVANLLNNEGFTYTVIGNQMSSKIGRVYGLFLYSWKIYRIANKFNPDILLSHGSMYAAFAAFFLRKTHVSLEDTFNNEQVRLYKPFTKTILTSDYDHPMKSKKVIRYAGYHELAYLHPSRFNPDETVLSELNISEGEPFVILRFVSWLASHDVGYRGISLQNKLAAVKAFSAHAKVFISSESPLQPELLQYHFPLPPHRMHDALAFASLVFGESSTMSEEAAMLGVPSVYLFNNSTYYTQHLEKDYGLIFNFSESEVDQQKAIERGIHLLRQKNIKKEWQSKRKRMLKDKIDVTAFLVWFIESYPESASIMRRNPDYQYNFR